MKMHKSDFAGTGKVYRFSLQQLFRSKANMISMVIMLVMAIGVVPLMVLLGGGEVSIDETLDGSVVYIQNDTSYALDTDALQEDYPAFAHTEFAEASFDKEEWKENLSSEDFYIHIYKNAEEGAYYLDVSYLEGSLYDGSDVLNTLENALTEAFDQARYDTLEATPEQLKIVTSTYATETLLLSEYLNADDTSWEVQYFLQLGYSIVVMMLSLLTVSYIIRAVVEEKASKLVELLMTSVKPMALLLGKILAAMTYVMGMILMMIAGFAISYGICSQFMDMSAFTQIFASMGLTGGDFHISPMTLIVVLVSILLGYITYAILAGLLGACCSTIEDTQSAMSLPTVLCMGGYMVATITSAMGGKGIAMFTSLCPFVSAFCAPVQYLLGNINLGIICISWLIQAVIILLLFWFSARIYRELIIYRGSRVKLSGMIAMARAGQGKKSSRQDA